MPRNGSGTYSLPESPFSPNTTISSTAVNSNFSDIATALTNSLATDGSTPITGQFSFDDGTYLLPAITFRSDQADGFYHISGASGGIGIAVNSAAGFKLLSPSAAAGAGLTGLNDAVLCPVGVVQDFAGSSAPAGWLLCYGQSVASATYPELYAVIGTTYGGDATNFALPDLRGRMLAGKDNMGGSAASRITTAGGGVDGVTLGAVGGAQNITIAQANLPVVTLDTTIASGQGSHTHAVTGGTQGGTTAGAFDGGAYGAPITAATIVISAATLPAMTGTTPLGGSGTAKATLNPTIIMNKIIFAGRA